MMTDKMITCLLPDGTADGGMRPMGYISADAVIDGTVDERGHLFFTNKTGNVNAGFLGVHALHGARARLSV